MKALPTQVAVLSPREHNRQIMATTFPKEALTEARFPAGTVLWFDDPAIGEVYRAEHVDPNTLTNNVLFQSGKCESWYVNARCRFFMRVFHTHEGIEACRDFPLWMVSKSPGVAQTPKTSDVQPNPKPSSAKPPLATAEGLRLVWKSDCWVFRIGRFLDRKSSTLSKTHSKWWCTSRPTISSGFLDRLGPFGPQKSTISGPETGRF